MFGARTFIVRIADDAMAPRVCAGDYVWVDPDEPPVHDSLVAVSAPWGGEDTVVRRLVQSDGRRTVCALDARCPECAVDDADIQGVVVYVAQAV